MIRRQGPGAGWESEVGRVDMKEWGGGGRGQWIGGDWDWAMGRGDGEESIREGRWGWGQ